jgi:hypothetical protein
MSYGYPPGDQGGGYGGQPPGGGYNEPPGYGQPPYGGRPAEPPNNHLVPAILTTFFCCSPFSLPAIYFAGKVNGKWEAGDYQGALEASANAKKWWMISLFVGLGWWVIVILFYVVVFATAIQTYRNNGG